MVNFMGVDPSLAALLGVGAVLVYVVVYLFSAPAIHRHGQRLKSAPNGLPLLGHGLLFLQPRQRLFDWFTRCEKQYPHETLQITVPTLPPGVIISSAENLDFVFKNEEKLFSKGRFFVERSLDLFGHGIINATGDLWREQRKAGLKFLSGRNLAALIEELLPSALDKECALLRGKAEAGEVIDFQESLMQVNTSVMGKMAYNMELNASDPFTVAFEHASGKIAERFQNPLWSVTEMFTGRGFRKSLAVVREQGRLIVANAVRARKSAGGDTDDTNSLIHHLMEHVQHEQVVADAALNYLSAGKDTTSQGLSWTFYLLLQHRDVIDKIRATINGRLQSGDIETLDKPEQFTPANLPYLLAVFYEAIRFYPPIPFEIKQTLEDTVLPDGTALQRGSVVVWCAWAMNRSVASWGPDVDEFRPERWLSERQDGGPPQFIQRGGAEFPSFNAGPRLCLGKKMAESVAVQVLATVLTRFDLEPAYEGERVSYSSLTLPMDGGLPVRITNRSI